MTFSLVARCAETGQFGVAISSSSPAVAARCAFARAGVGAVASQNVTDPRLGTAALDLMAGGMSAAQAVAKLVATRDHMDYRQVLTVDAQGVTGIHSGPNSLGIWTSAMGRDAVSGGNLLANDGVPTAIVAGFETATGPLGDRLIAAMRAGLKAGGEAGPVRSAGLLIVDRQAWPYAELRCDWIDDGCPIDFISRAWQVYAPQAKDYVTRALNPAAAPSYGVPGDE
ncbi:fimbrial assembly protein FimA [Salipiger aestuarii]|uniref:Putative Ntn-hydrolase superfamily protein n=1 Tax=Salipiger aestuarii TaxID=568098 RepID=A0A327XYY9_9RHOB|nr:DUF1028 domain-containing protein [Salipiger aestuarii]KAA8605568.1 fimbrial assembly protein FimA [Salipiger aestuarii]KAA8608975.1 fimbrial assembly protein FimA [Salipiger aestuarii]KAB2541187.1 fimbrial assembly protein FimA [Salipiger aestuarii]RAK13824.1 putative Ntn-hydrolase superfamily protein [Salipiger aestuarii]